MEHQGAKIIEGITGSFDLLDVGGNVNFNRGEFTHVTASTFSVTSSYAHEFVLSNSAVGTPYIYSPTNLNLSASNAVVVTSSPFRLKTLTNSQTSSYTPQDGDLIFNSDRASYMAYSGSNWQEILLTGYTASYALNSTSSSFSISSSISDRTLAFGLSTTSSASNPQDGDIMFDTTGSGSFAKKFVGYSGSAWHSFILDNDVIASASYATSASFSTTASYVTTAQTASYISAPNIDGIVTSASNAITASYAENISTSIGYNNEVTLSADYTSQPNSYNSFYGPLAIGSGVTVTVQSNSYLKIENF